MDKDTLWAQLSSSLLIVLDSVFFEDNVVCLFHDIFDIFFVDRDVLRHSEFVVENYDWLGCVKIVLQYSEEWPSYVLIIYTTHFMIVQHLAHVRRENTVDLYYKFNVIKKDVV